MPYPRSASFAVRSRAICWDNTGVESLSMGEVVKGLGRRVMRRTWCARDQGHRLPSRAVICAMWP
jgi:hypothetical protein